MVEVVGHLFDFTEYFGSGGALEGKITAQDYI